MFLMEHLFGGLNQSTTRMFTTKPEEAESNPATVKIANVELSISCYLGMFAFSFLVLLIEKAKGRFAHELQKRKEKEDGGKELFVCRGQQIHRVRRSQIRPSTGNQVHPTRGNQIRPSTGKSSGARATTAIIESESSPRSANVTSLVICCAQTDKTPRRDKPSGRTKVKKPETMAVQAEVHVSEEPAPLSMCKGKGPRSKNGKPLEDNKTSDGASESQPMEVQNSMPMEISDEKKPPSEAKEAPKRDKIHHRKTKVAPASKENKSSRMFN